MLGTTALVHTGARILPLIDGPTSLTAVPENPDEPTADPPSELIALLDEERLLATGLACRLLQGGPRDTLF
jgi:hypothetical protein